MEGSYPAPQSHMQLANHKSSHQTTSILTSSSCKMTHQHQNGNGHGSQTINSQHNTNHSQSTGWMRLQCRCVIIKHMQPTITTSNHPHQSQFTHRSVRRSHVSPQLQQHLDRLNTSVDGGQVQGGLMSTEVSFTLPHIKYLTLSVWQW